MNPILHTASLTPAEQAVVRQFEQFVRKVYGMSLATYLLLELEDGRAVALDKTNVEYKVMTRWQ